MFLAIGYLTKLIIAVSCCLVLIKYLIQIQSKSAKKSSNIDIDHFFKY